MAPALTYTPNPVPSAATASVAGTGFASRMTQIRLDGEVQGDSFKPARGGSFRVGIVVKTTDTATTQKLTAHQRLKGSDPWVQVVSKDVAVAAGVVTPVPPPTPATVPKYFASVLFGLDNPTRDTDAAVAAGLDGIRIVNMLDESAAGNPIDAARWAKVDALVAAARARSLKVVLDLSTYRNQLLAKGQNPYTGDWTSFLAFVTGRYQGIDQYSLAGEPEPPNGSGSGRPTTTQLTAFYAKWVAHLKGLSPGSLVTSGGLLQLDWNSGIDWQAIFRASDVCQVHVYSAGDEGFIATAAAYAGSLGKPFQIEEFGKPQSVGDQTRADWFGSIYARAAASTGFWNLGPEVKADSHDVNTGTPATWAVVKAKKAGPPTTPLTVSGVVVAVSQTGAGWKWHVSEKATGQVAYGKTTAYGMTTTLEPSFTYQDHEQSATGLEPGTTYHYQITSRDAAGRVAQTKDAVLLTMPAAPVPIPPTPIPPSGDLAPPPAGQDAGALITATLATRDVRLQAGATYVCSTPIVAKRNGSVLDGNTATAKMTFVGEGIKIENGVTNVTVQGLTLRGAYFGTGWADANHAFNVMGGGGHKFIDVWIYDFQGDAYYLQGSWPSGSSQAIPGTSVRITGGGAKHVGRMGIGVVHFDGGYLADWSIEDCYTPLDFEPDNPSNARYSASCKHWLIERVKIRGKTTGSDGSGSQWLQIGSPQLGGPFPQQVEDIEVRYCDIEVTNDNSPHNAISTGTDGSFRPKNLRIHHNTARSLWYRGALIEHTDGVVLTDNVTPVRSQPWAVLNDCKAPIDVARNA